MKFVFLNRDTGTGGLQTAILRKVRWLRRNGHECVVLAASLGNLTESIQRYSTVLRVSYTNYFGLSSDPIVRRAIAGADCVHTFSWDSLVLALRIAQSEGCALIVGVYHPRAFNFFPIPPRPYYAEFHRELLGQLDDRNVLFMNESTRGTHQVDFDRTFSNSVVLPIPIELPIFASGARMRQRTPLRLLSVGRLVNFKRYPIGVCELIATGRWTKDQLRFSIYGDGPHRRDIEVLVSKGGIGGQVHLGGEVAYSDVGGVIDLHDAFIGMGTSALEAAAVGLPTIVAPAYGDGKLVSGFFFEQTGYNYGEVAGDRPVDEVIEKLLGCTDAEFDELSQRERRAAERFGADVVMAAYISYVQSVQALPPPLPVVPSVRVLRSVFSGFATTRVPFLRGFWRRRNWHHPAQDK